MLPFLATFGSPAASTKAQRDLQCAQLNVVHAMPKLQAAAGVVQQLSATCSNLICQLGALSTEHLQKHTLVQGEFYHQIL